MKLITTSKPMATKLTMASSATNQRAMEDIVNERANDNAYLKKQNGDDWQEIVDILTNAGITSEDSVLMDQFSEDDCNGFDLDTITIYQLFGDLRAETDKGYVYLPDVLTDEDDIYTLIDILADGLT